MRKILGREVDMSRVEDQIIARFAEVFDMPLEAEAKERAEAIPDIQTAIS
jgi:hypothetical protein